MEAERLSRLGAAEARLAAAEAEALEVAEDLASLEAEVAGERSGSEHAVRDLQALLDEVDALAAKIARDSPALTSAQRLALRVDTFETPQELMSQTMAADVPVHKAATEAAEARALALRQPYEAQVRAVETLKQEALRAVGPVERAEVILKAAAEAEALVKAGRELCGFQRAENLVAWRMRIGPFRVRMGELARFADEQKRILAEMERLAAADQAAVAARQKEQEWPAFFPRSSSLMELLAEDKDGATLSHGSPGNSRPPSASPARRTASERRPLRLLQGTRRTCLASRTPL